MGGKTLLPDSAYQELAENSFERKTIEALSKFYANFAKYRFVFSFLLFSIQNMCCTFPYYSHFSSLYRNPLPDAEPILFGSMKAAKTIQYNYLDITNNGIESKLNPNRERIEFWNEIFDKYSVHWQIREFNINSLAVKVPLILLASLLLLILCCKTVKICMRKNRKTIAEHHP